MLAFIAGLSPVERAERDAACAKALADYREKFRAEQWPEMVQREAARRALPVTNAQTAAARATDDNLLAEGGASAAAVFKRVNNREHAAASKKRKFAAFDEFSAVEADVARLEARIVYLEGQRGVVAMVEEDGPAVALAPASSAGDLTLRAELDALKRELEAPNHKSEYGRFLNVKLEKDGAKDLAALMEKEEKERDKAAIERVKDRFCGRKCRARKEAKLAKVPILEPLVTALTARVVRSEEDLRAAARAPELTAPPPARETREEG